GRLTRHVARIDPNLKYWRVNGLSSDGKRLLGNAGGDGKAWDTLSGREILTVSDASDGDLTMSSDGARIAARGKDNIVKLHDGSTGRELVTAGNVAAVSFSRAGRQIDAGRPDKTVDMLDSTTGLQIRNLTTLDDVMAAVARSPDGRRVSIKSASGLVRLFDLAGNRQVAERRGAKDAEALFSADGTYWAFADGKDTVEVLNAETGAV